MGREGLEPPVSERADLQSARLPVTGYSPNLKKLLLIALSIIMFIQESSEYFKFTTIDSCRNNTYDFIWITLLQTYSFNLLDKNFFIFQRSHCGPSRIRTYDLLLVTQALLNQLSYRSIMLQINYTINLIFEKNFMIFFNFCWATRIRTQTDRTRICSATITQ